MRPAKRKPISKEEWAAIGVKLVEILTPVLRCYQNISLRVVPQSQVNQDLPPGVDATAQFKIRRYHSRDGDVTFYFASGCFFLLDSVIEALLHEVAHVLCFTFFKREVMGLKDCDETEAIHEAIARLIELSPYLDEPGFLEFVRKDSGDSCGVILSDTEWAFALDIAGSIKSQYGSMFQDIIDAVCDVLGDSHD